MRNNSPGLKVNLWNLVGLLLVRMCAGYITSGVPILGGGSHASAAAFSAAGSVSSVFQGGHHSISHGGFFGPGHSSGYGSVSYGSSPPAIGAGIQGHLHSLGGLVSQLQPQQGGFYYESKSPSVHKYGSSFGTEYSYNSGSGIYSSSSSIGGPNVVEEKIIPSGSHFVSSYDSGSGIYSSSSSIGGHNAIEEKIIPSGSHFVSSYDSGSGIYSSSSSIGGPNAVEEKIIPSGSHFVSSVEDQKPELTNIYSTIIKSFSIKPSVSVITNSDTVFGNDKKPKFEIPDPPKTTTPVPYSTKYPSHTLVNFKPLSSASNSSSTTPRTSRSSEFHPSTDFIQDAPNLYE